MLTLHACCSQVSIQAYGYVSPVYADDLYVLLRRSVLLYRQKESEMSGRNLNSIAIDSISLNIRAQQRRPRESLENFIAHK